MDMHSALKTEILAKTGSPGINLIHVLLQQGRKDFVETIHVRPNTWSTAGVQTPDLLILAGFSHQECAFFGSQCFCRVVELGTDVQALANALSEALESLRTSIRALQNCGIAVPQIESAVHPRNTTARGNGHASPQSKRLKELEDEYFYYVMTWLEGGADKGWTTHYRPKRPPLSPEFEAVIAFIGRFHAFEECPEYNFERCMWRFLQFESTGQGLFESNTEFAHQCFDAHRQGFSKGLEGLLETHRTLDKFGMSFITVKEPGGSEVVKAVTEIEAGHSAVVPEQFDVAISFAGPERQYAEELASVVREAGFSVFYDAFYPEHLWGKDLAAFFDRIYRKDSRYCVMFLSQEYADRIWTNHERRSAQARALEEKGKEYILPVRVEQVDLDGLPPTIGYLSLEQDSIEEIGRMLIAKLSDS